MAARLKEKYQKEALPLLMKRFNYRSVMQVPRLEKIVINMGVSGAREDRKILDAAMQQLALITGQRPKVTRAKKSVSNFRIRKGMALGCQVTVRGDRMYELFDRLVTIALPRIRDFRGLSRRSFDGHGNYSLGIAEQTVFPEIPYDQVERVQGMDVTLVTTARTDAEAMALLEALGLPLRQT